MGCARVSGVGIGQVLGRILGWVGYQVPLRKAPLRLPIDNLPPLNFLCAAHSEKQTEYSFRAGLVGKRGLFQKGSPSVTENSLLVAGA